MATATSSKPHSPSAFDRLGAALACVDGRRVLIALRIIDLERLAWRGGRARALALERRAVDAFARIARRTLREGDAVAHEAGSDVLLAALLAPVGTTDVPRTARTVTRELVAELTREGLSIEAGWTIHEPGPDPALALRASSEAAMVRGRAERERYAFFANLGHEMRTPLMSIDGYLDTILERELDADTARHFTEVAQREAIRLRRLVEGMYALSLIDLDAEIVNGASCDAQNAVERACDAIYPVAARRNVRVRVRSRVHCGIPLATEHAVQTFVSILENAVKHGYESGRIDVYLEERPAGLSISFDDDGPGVPEADRVRIFEPLARGAAASAAGHGLGLAIVRATVGRVGGDVDVTRSSRNGARFTVNVPRVDPEATREISPPIPRKMADGITMRSS